MNSTNSIESKLLIIINHLNKIDKRLEIIENKINKLRIVREFLEEEEFTDAEEGEEILYKPNR